MTPPPAATHPLTRSRSTVRRASNRFAAATIARILDARGWARLRLLLDLFVMYIATTAAVFTSAPVHIVSGERLLAAVFPLVVVGLMHARRSPDDRLWGSLLETCVHVIGVVSLAAMATVAADSVIGGVHPVGLTLRLWVFSSVYLGIARVVLLSVRRSVVRLEEFSTPTLIVGAGLVGEHLVKRLMAERRYGLRPVGFIDSDPRPIEDTSIPFVPVLGGLDDLDTALERTGAKRVILAFSTEPDLALVDKVRRCQAQDVEVSLVPRLYEAINERATLDHVGGLPLLSLRLMDPKGWQFAIKHALDRTVAFLALLAFAPVMLAIAIAVRLTSPGPILFRQQRVGRDGHIFDLLKFRTMREPADTPEFQPEDGCAPGGIEGIDRRTSIGRWLRTTSLDELPQFINVLRGDMSLVGPRPERPEFVARFSAEVARYEDRHRVKSGITGWAQVNGLRGQTSIADRVEWDNYYIQNWSLRLDLRILAFTIAEIFRFRG